MIDPRIVRFIGRHHVLTLATVAGEQPYCSHAFYAYAPERKLHLFVVFLLLFLVLEMLAF